jgi:hypothetical protein
MLKVIRVGDYRIIKKPVEIATEVTIKRRWIAVSSCEQL